MGNNSRERGVPIPWFGYVVLTLIAAICIDGPHVDRARFAATRPRRHTTDVGCGCGRSLIGGCGGRRGRSCLGGSGRSTTPVAAAPKAPQIAHVPTNMGRKRNGQEKNKIAQKDYA